jgi:hypothetical protein
MSQQDIYELEHSPYSPINLPDTQYEITEILEQDYNIILSIKINVYPHNADIILYYDTLAELLPIEFQHYEIIEVRKKKGTFVQVILYYNYNGSYIYTDDIDLEDYINEKIF